MNTDPLASDAELAPEGDLESTPPPKAIRRRFLPMLSTFVIMALIWVVLSGKLDPFHLSLGAISCGLVTWFSSDLLFPTRESARFRFSWVRFAAYVPWLMWEIVKANIWVLYVTLHPRMMDKINPRIIRFRSTLTGRMAQVTFANSITLTPGTITVDVDADGNFTVHAIDDKCAAGLPGAMEQKIAKVFGE